MKTIALSGSDNTQYVDYFLRAEVRDGRKVAVFQMNRAAMQSGALDKEFYWDEQTVQERYDYWSKELAKKEGVHPLTLDIGARTFNEMGQALLAIKALG